MAASAVTQGGPERDPALAELRERVYGDFRSLAATRAALRNKVREATDVTLQVRQHPLWVLGLAAGTGLAFAYVLRQGRKRIAGRLLAMLAAAAVRRVGGALRPAGAARGASGPTRPRRPAARPGDH